MKFLLIVSHESSVQESLRMILKEDFYVLSAKTGSEALMMMAQHPVDVVLLDSNLPDYKVPSLMEKVREISEVIPLVIISSTKGPGPLVDMKAGYCEILVKPFERDEVQWVVKKALHHRQLLRELELARSRGDTAQEARYALAQAQEIPSYPIHVGSLYPSGRELFGLHYALKDFFKALTHITDLERLLDFILHAVAELFQVNKASVSLFESSQYHYRVRGALGLDETRLATLVFKATEGLPAWFLRYNRILRKEDIERDAFSKEAALLNDQLEALDAKISAPLLAKGKLVGIISLGNKVTGRTFSEADVELLSMISNYTAMAIENSLLYREISLQKSYNENLLKNIASGVIAIDTRGRVTTYNPAAARIIRVSRQEVLGKAVQKLGSVFADILLRTVEGNEIFSRYEVAHPMTKAPLGVSTSLL
ncbi:MAG: GAF domain-containing protein, partial [Thermodesulfobacteriota bacterium]